VAELTDETLMAYADNELAPAERQQVAAILAGRPEFVEKVRRFERTRLPLQRAFDEVLHAPVPADLLERVRRPTPQPVSLADFAAQRRPRQVAAGMVALDAATKSGLASSWKPMALAASLSLLIGGAAGWYGRSLEAGGQSAGASQISLASGVHADGAMQLALDSRASGIAPGAQANTTNAIGVKPVATFRSRDQRYCRQYELTTGSAAQYDGVACRNAAGTWDIVFHAEAMKRTAGSGNLAPAGADGSNAIDAAIERLIDGGILDPHEEQGVLAGKWKMP
jgi:surface antigen